MLLFSFCFFKFFLLLAASSHMSLSNIKAPLVCLLLDRPKRSLSNVFAIFRLCVCERECARVCMDYRLTFALKLHLLGYARTTKEDFYNVQSIKRESMRTNLCLVALKVSCQEVLHSLVIRKRNDVRQYLFLIVN